MIQKIVLHNNLLSYHFAHMLSIKYLPRIVTGAEQKLCHYNIFIHADLKDLSSWLLPEDIFPVNNLVDEIPTQIK